MSEFPPENLPGQSIPTSSSGFAAAAFIPSGGDVSLTTDMPGLAGYIEAPPGFTKVASSGIATFPTNDRMSFVLGANTIIQHDVVVTYKLTDVGSDSAISTLPAGGTTLQIALVDGTDTILQTAGAGPVNIMSLRKFDNGKHDTIILRGRIDTANGDIARIKFFTTNAARINVFSVSWKVSTA